MLPPPIPTKRAIVTQSDHALEIDIPAKKDQKIIGMIYLWLIIWIFVGLIAIAAVGVDRNGVWGNFKLIAWIIVWAIGTVVVIYNLIWKHIGHEIIRIENGVLTKKIAIGMLSRQYSYEIDSLQNLVINRDQAINYKIKGFVPYMRQYFNRGKIMFDYEGINIKIIDEVEFDEAEILLKTLKTMLPHQEEHIIHSED